ncbi:MAG: hypothetical protein QM657_12595 [Lacrimispora sp.]|uniref:hypothetical protein n=1 Tax=Lacrimispora sp. TaxID=2719234 RepID=UPI0039E41753
MILGILLFAFLSFVFSSPRHHRLMSSEPVLSPREEKAGVLFGRYTGDAAVVLLLLWVLRAFNLPWIHVIAGGVLFLRTLAFLIYMAGILIED